MVIRSLFIIAFLKLGNFLLLGQELSATSSCLLFDSELEKRAFLQKNDDDKDALIFLLLDDPKTDSIRYFKIKNELEEYSHQLISKKKKFKNDLAFLKYVFSNIHNKYLGNYDNQEVFSNIFQNRKYNCVTGTALYAYLFDQLGYCISIKETRFHLFLIVELSETSRVMVETTDPYEGFIIGNETVNGRINNYLSKERIAVRTNKKVIAPPFGNNEVYCTISFKNLGGLHYYNKAVDLVNRQEYAQALPILKKAYLLYSHSDRIVHFLWYAESLYDQQISEAFSNR